MDYAPSLVEWLIDGDTAYLTVHGLEVINRIKTLPLMDLDHLDPLQEEPWKCCLFSLIWLFNLGEL
jgi:hypothetical protein